MFGVAPNSIGVPSSTLGPQVRGFGFLHDGSIGTLAEFFAATHFDFDVSGSEPAESMIEFLLEFPTGLSQHDGLEAASPSEPPGPGVDDPLGRCVMVAHAVVAGRRRGFLDSRQPDPEGRSLIPDSRAEARISFAELDAMADSAVIGMCAPPEIAVRLALDHDENGVWDGDEATAAGR